MRIHRRGSVILALLLTAATPGQVLGQSPSPVAHTTFHIELTGGPMAGTYVVARPELCAFGFVTGDDWFASYSDPSATPSVVSLDVTKTPDQNALTIGFGETGVDPEYTTVPQSPKVEETDNGAILTVAGTGTTTGTDGSAVDAGTMTVTVTCNEVTRMGGALPSSPPESPRSPVPLGSSPAPGSTTFHVELDGGPFAGVYDLWNAGEGLCTADDTKAERWSATFQDDGATPDNVGLFIDREEPDRSTFSLSFGSGDAPTLYMNVEEDPTLAIDDRHQSATVDAAWQHSQLVTPDGSLVEGGPVRIVVNCASVERVPLESPGHEENEEE